MKSTKIIYWILTGLFALFMIFSAIQELRQTPEGLKFMTNLGYPPYLSPFLGVTKILGVIALLVPGFPRLKEWAYAGFVIDLIGATYSMIAINAPASGWVFMFVFIAAAFASYFLYHKILKNSAQAVN